MAGLNRLVATGRSAGSIQWPFSSTKCGAAEWLNSHKNSYSKSNIWNSPNRSMIIAKVRVSQHNPWKIKRGEGGNELIAWRNSSTWGGVRGSSGGGSRGFTGTAISETQRLLKLGRKQPKRKGSRRRRLHEDRLHAFFISLTTLNFIPRKLQNYPVTSLHHVLCAHELINRQLEYILPPPTPPLMSSENLLQHKTLEILKP